MEMKFKTSKRETFQMIVESSETIRDVIVKIENILGKENFYRLIQAGKLLEEGKHVRDCNLSTLLPVIVMVTDASQQEEDERNIALVENCFRKDDCDVASGSKSESDGSGYNSEDEQSNNAITEKEFELKLKKSDAM